VSAVGVVPLRNGFVQSESFGQGPMALSEWVVPDPPGRRRYSVRSGHAAARRYQ